MGINRNQILFERKETSKVSHLYFTDKSMAEKLTNLVLDPIQLHLINGVVEDHTEDFKTTPITESKDEGACSGGAGEGRS